MLDFPDTAVIRTHPKYRGRDPFAEDDAIRLRGIVGKPGQIPRIPVV